MGQSRHHDAQTISVDAKAGKVDSQPAPPRMSDKAKTAATKGPSPTKDEGLFKEAIFSPDCITDYPVDREARYAPTAQCFETICSQTYGILTASNRQFSNAVTPELYRVYVAQLLWLRFLHVSIAQTDLLDYTSSELVALASQNPLSVPAPIALWLQSFGTVTSATGERIRLAVPDLPRQAQGHHLPTNR